MKFNFRKIASVLASVVMIGSTIGIAAAANYPAPFVQGGKATVGVVVGSGAGIASSDFLAAADLGSSLASELAKQTATTGTSTGATATGGDSVNLATSSQRLYFSSSLSTARTTLSKSELPTLLADGQVIDDAGTTYTYSQSITVGGGGVGDNSRIQYSTSGSDFDDPILLIQSGTSAESGLYKYSMTFNKNLNVTNANVRGNDLSILGTTYTIASGSDGAATTPVVVLFGSGDSKTLDEGQTTKVTIGDKEYNVAVTAISQVSSVNYAHVSVDGSSPKKIAEDASSKIGDIEIYVKSVTYSAKETTQNAASLVIGTKRLKLENGQPVKTGSDETTIQGTRAGVAVASGSISGINVSIAMQKSTKDYIKAGETFLDPVFGNLKINFAGITPTLDDTTRDKITIDTDNSLNAKVTMTTANAGKEFTLYYVKDQDSSDSTITPRLADSANKTIHLIENESIRINEIAVINAGDFGRIIKLTDDTGGGQLSSTSKIAFDDVATGESLFGASGLTVGTAGQAQTTINGEPYYFWINPDNNNTVHITWGASAGYAATGSAVTLFPRIKLKNGEWMAIVTNVTVNNNTVYALPGVETLSTYETGSVLGYTNTTTIGNGAYSKSFGNVNYTVQNLDVNISGTAHGIGAVKGLITQITDSAGNICNLSYMLGPAILVIEKKKVTESGNSDNGDVICIASTVSGTTTPVKIAIAEPRVTGNWSGFQTLASDSYKKRAVTKYGSYIEYNSQTNHYVTIQYPTEQMYMDVLFTAPEATVTGGTSTGGSVAELGFVTVIDSDVSQVSGKDLIVIGGSCINSVAAKLLGSDTPLCSAAFTAKTQVGADQALLKVFESPYTTGKVAMLVAGYEAADTTKAVKYLVTEKPATDKNASIKLSTSTAVATKLA